MHLSPRCGADFLEPGCPHPGLMYGMDTGVRAPRLQRRFLNVQIPVELYACLIMAPTDPSPPFTKHLQSKASLWRADPAPSFQNKGNQSRVRKGGAGIHNLR